MGRSRQIRTLLIGAVVLAVLLAAYVMRPAPAVQGAAISVPSGQPIGFKELISNERGPSGLTFRYRFIAPEIARDNGTIGFEEAAEDMQHLCETYALPRVASAGPLPSQIVISLADRDVEFGATDPEATQYFEAYSIDGETCIWEGF